MNRKPWRNPKPTNRKTKKKMNQEQRSNEAAAVERRYFGPTGEIRAKAESRSIEGSAAVFGTTYDMGWFTEEIHRDALKDADMSDVVALLNHDSNIVLGRTSAGTLSLSVDQQAFRYTFDAPNSPNGDNALEAIKRGDIKQSSWGFTVDTDEWNTRDGREHRTITKVRKVYDVSPVTFPANPDTTVAKRSLEAYAKPTQRHKETALEDQQAAYTEQQNTNAFNALDMDLRLLEMAAD
jgi:HK97 family phage prohead protease